MNSQILPRKIGQYVIVSDKYRQIMNFSLNSRFEWIILSDEIYLSVEGVYHRLRQIKTNDKYYCIFSLRSYHRFRWNKFVYRRTYLIVCERSRQTTNIILNHRSEYIIYSDEIYLSIEDVYRRLWQMKTDDKFYTLFHISSIVMEYLSIEDV